MGAPPRSRGAAARVHFRLLARDAQEHLKRLSIVASDPATRALAASAGLPVFASVAEYEEAFRGGEGEPAADDAAGRADVEPGADGEPGRAGRGDGVAT